MIIASSSRWIHLCLALGLVCIPALGQEESNNHSLRGGGETETSRLLAGGGGQVVVDFEQFGLKGGDYVTNQYQGYGLTFSKGPDGAKGERGGCGGAPRVFDSSYPYKDGQGDKDLGSPNESCDGGGPGWGEGGKKGARGENCNPLHNVLIIQECDQLAIPDDNVAGGEIYLDFNPPAEYVYDMGFLDADYEVTLKVEYGNGLTKYYTVPNFGDNGYSEVDINLSNVRRITIDEKRSAALVFIRFIPGQTPPEVTDPPRIDTTITIDYDLIFITDPDVCFDPVAWCDTLVFDILMNALSQEDDLTPEQFDVLLNGLQALYCDSAASALADAFAAISGSGKFRLSRVGSTVDNIRLDVDMTSATWALVDVDASAIAAADAYAYAFARAQSCSKFQANALKFRLCALAKGEAESEAIAVASSYSSAAAVASAFISTNVAVEVDADRIREFNAQVSSGVSSFVTASATASAFAFAAAYAEALAKIKVSTKIKEYHCCRHKKRYRNKFCKYGNKCGYHYDWHCYGQCGWWSTVFSERFKLLVEATSSQVEASFAAALAESLAAIDVITSMRAYFKDGDPDIVFGADGSLRIDASTQCFA